MRPPRADLVTINRATEVGREAAIRTASLKVSNGSRRLIRQYRKLTFADM